MAFRASAVSFWKFLPIAAGFWVAVAAISLTVADLHLRFRSTYPRDEGLWGNKWLIFVLMQTAVVYGVAALVCWPLFWISLRHKRLKPALAFLLVAVTAGGLFTLDLEQVSYAPFVVLLVALGICAWSGIFDQQAATASTHLRARTP